MDNVEITSEDLNELRQINPLALAQLQNIALARKLKEKDEQLNILTKKVAPEKPDETPIEFTGRLADMRKRGMSSDKWWLADDKLLEANQSISEGFDT